MDDQFGTHRHKPIRGVERRRRRSHGRCFQRGAQRIPEVHGSGGCYLRRQEIHVVLDNLSTHSGSDVDKMACQASERHLPLHADRQSSWLNKWKSDSALSPNSHQARAFTSLRQLINTINTYIANWNRDSESSPTWTAGADEMITKVRLLHQDFKKLLANNVQKDQSVAKDGDAGRPRAVSGLRLHPSPHHRRDRRRTAPPAPLKSRR